MIETKSDEEKREILTGIYHEKVNQQTINGLVYFNDNIITSGDGSMDIELRTLAAKMKDVQVRHNEATER